MKVFGYDDGGPMANAMAKAILGDRWAIEFGRITVHIPSRGKGQSYTAYLPSELLKNGKLKTGDNVAVRLTSVDVSPSRRDWYCDDFQVVR